MELWFGLFGVLAAALLTDILLKVADALYMRHSALLLHASGPRRPFFRGAALYLMIIGMSVLLMQRQTMPLDFAAVWLPSLFVLLIIVTDYEQQLIFNRVLLGLALITCLFTPWIEAPFLNRSAAALLGGGIMLALCVLSRGGIGGGDIKLLFVLGLWQGLDALLFVLTFGFITSGIAAALLLLTGRKKRRDYLAYGPYFALGALVNLLR